MTNRKLLRGAWNNLSVNLMRSILTMLGIIIGVASVIIMLALGNGAKRQVDEQIRNLGGNVFVVFGGSFNSAGVRGQAGSLQRLTDADADAIEHNISAVVAAAPELRSNVQVISGNLNWSTNVIGSDNRLLVAQNWTLSDGREFSVAELGRGAKVALIGETLRRELFGAGEAIGQTIRVNKLPVTVIGVLGAKGQSARGDDQDDVLIMPLDTVRKKISGINRANPRAIRSITVKVATQQDMPWVEEEMTRLLSQRLKSAGNDIPFRIRNLSEIVETRMQAMQVFNSLLAGVAAVSLLVGGIGIMNIMLVSVTERTREIGLRMAVGAKPGDILRQFLVESVLLCGVGGAIGIVIAALTCLVLAQGFAMAAVLQWQVAILSLGFSAVIGIFFGYYPARQAAGLQPIDALRYE